MKISLVQFDVKPGWPEKTIERILRHIKEAENSGIDVICFPEQIFGYLVGDMWNHDAYCLDLMEYNQSIVEATKNGIVAIWGNVYLDKRFTYDHGLYARYNAAMIAQNGKYISMVGGQKTLPSGMYIKTLLPNYRMFDDKRYFMSSIALSQYVGCSLSELIKPFTINIQGHNRTIGLQLCEDLWWDGSYHRNKNGLNPAKYLMPHNPDLIINLSASPWTIGKNDARDRRIKHTRDDCGDKFPPYYYVNCVGSQNNGKNIITFDGGSTVYGTDGLPRIFGNSDFVEKQIICVHDCLIETATKTYHQQIVNRLPAIKRTASVAPIGQKFNAIVRGLQHITEMAGLDKPPYVVIGLSGGIDSSLVACQCVHAFGKDRVVGINMPTVNNSEALKGSASELAKALDIEYKVVSIQQITELVNSTLEKTFGQVGDLAQENVQAKIRSIDILSNAAQIISLQRKSPAIYTCNGNKDELALGYATLDGDCRGAIAPIADVVKSEVFDMARYYQEEIAKKQIIPDILFPDHLFRFDKNKKAPSAELQPQKNNQVDPILIGWHCSLITAMTDYVIRTPEDFCEWWIQGIIHEKLPNMSLALMDRYAMFNPQNFIADLRWVISMMNAAVKKRVQSVPGIITTKTAYGFDRRESVPMAVPVTQNFVKLAHVIDLIDLEGQNYHLR